jgi:quercetin dioxygenase-like cupin family protein
VSQRTENGNLKSAQATIVANLQGLHLEAPGAAAAAVYDRPIGLRLLYTDANSAEEHYLVRYPPGVRCRVHRHSSAHTIVVLHGQLDANGQLVGPGSYAHFPAGEPMRHQAPNDEGCLFVLLFHGPLDVEIIGD